MRRPRLAAYGWAGTLRGSLTLGAGRTAGVDHVGLGGDFDGVEDLPDGLEDVSCYPALVAELLDRGWSQDECTRLIGGNVLRAFREAEAVARSASARRGPSTASIEDLDRT